MTTIVDFDYAIVRWVPSVSRGEVRNIGVVLHAPAARFLEARFATPDDAPKRVQRYIAVLALIASGDDAGGPLAGLPRSERFHWLTAPRSDSIQTSPCHPGRAERDQLDEALAHIFDHAVQSS